ncbi:hypothetical protein AGRO_4175 [Agrobacterium sp. ATCC 31749]|nr:hypothetical protein AGRO_4175 [Agrobacterium sp. ATCC 31749]
MPLPQLDSRHRLPIGPVYVRPVYRAVQAALFLSVETAGKGMARMPPSGLKA